MNREKIIKLAREAGFEVYGTDVWITDGWWLEELERFAALVAAVEREKVAAWMMARGYATGHGDTIEDLLVELEWQVRESEREACAKVCEGIKYDDYSPPEDGRAPEYYDNAARDCADAIRARGEK